MPRCKPALHVYRSNLFDGPVFPKYISNDTELVKNNMYNILISSLWERRDICPFGKVWTLVHTQPTIVKLSPLNP